MEKIETIIQQALQEDIGSGDHATLSCIPGDVSGKAELLVKEPGIVAGLDVAEMVFKLFDADIKFHPYFSDGSKIQPGNILFEVEGKVRSILQCERLALNFLQRMSGIATRTAFFVSLTEGTKARILDTRKTTPNFRIIEKTAVKTGGGENHRMGLYDMIMIKDNHIDFAGGISNALDRVHEYLPGKGLDIKVEIEVRDMDELTEVIADGRINRILLDNFSVEKLGEAVRLVNGRFETEASGGITEDNIRQVALSGVDFISVGALTHHVKSLDMSLKASF